MTMLFSLCSIPLSVDLPKYCTTYNVTNSDQGNSSRSVCFSGGVALENHNWTGTSSRGLQQSREDASGGVYGNIAGSMGSANADFPANAKNSQLIALQPGDIVLVLLTE